MNRFLTNRLAAKAGTRAAELLVKADAAGDAIEHSIRGIQKVIIANLRPGIHNATHNYNLAARMLQNLPAQIWRALRMHVTGLLLWSHDRAANAMLHTLPKPYLRQAYAARRFEPASGARRLMEHGPVTFGIGPAGLTTQDLSVSASDEAELWRRFLFPPPSADMIGKILDTLLPPSFVQDTFDFAGATPESLASTIARAFADGQSTADIGRMIRPYFDGSAMRAQRTARTLGAYVGTERNLATSEQLGDMIIGYQVHSAGGENARHEHALRSGTVYYRDPKPGQWGMSVMPHPPRDSQLGPHDDMTAPGGLCFNCRCWLTPVLAPLHAFQSPTFTDNADKLIPDPSHFADWFETANIQQRRKAAGVRRLAVAADVLDREPTWADLVNPASGQLVSVDQLKSETPAARALRRAKVDAIISMNRRLIQQTAAFATV